MLEALTFFFLCIAASAIVGGGLSARQASALVAGRNRAVPRRVQGRRRAR